MFSSRLPVSPWFKGRPKQKPERKPKETPLVRSTSSPWIFGLGASNRELRRLGGLLQPQSPAATRGAGAGARGACAGVGRLGRERLGSVVSFVSPCRFFDYKPVLVGWASELETSCISSMVGFLLVSVSSNLQNDALEKKTCLESLVNLESFRILVFGCFLPMIADLSGKLRRKTTWKDRIGCPVLTSMSTNDDSC